MQSYFYSDDAFNFNYAQAKAALGSYQEAEKVAPRPTHLCAVHVNAKELLKSSDESSDHSFQFFLMVQSEKIKSDYVFLSWLARCCRCMKLSSTVSSSACSFLG